MNFPQDFKRIFYFSNLTPKYDTHNFLIRKLLELENELNIQRGLIMILKKDDFGVFSYIVLNGISENEREFNFTSQEVLYDGRKGYQKSFRIFLQTYKRLNVGPNGGRISKNSKWQKIPYLVTDVKRFE